MKRLVCFADHSEHVVIQCEEDSNTLVVKAVETATKRNILLKSIIVNSEYHDEVLANEFAILAHVQEVQTESRREETKVVLRLT